MWSRWFPEPLPVIYSCTIPPLPWPGSATGSPQTASRSPWHSSQPDTWEVSPHFQLSPQSAHLCISLKWSLLTTCSLWEGTGNCTKALRWSLVAGAGRAAERQERCFGGLTGLALIPALSLTSCITLDGLLELAGGPHPFHRISCLPFSWSIVRVDSKQT